jgi:hypothetical protein
MLVVSNQGSVLEEQMLRIMGQGAEKNAETSSTYEQNNVAVQLNSERLKFIDEFSRLILELKNQFPELAQSLSKARDYISANQENMPIKNLMNLLSAIQQNLEVLENKPVPAQRLELVEAIKNLVQEVTRILQPNSEIPAENKLILALSQNDFASANAAIKNIVEQVTPQMQQATQVQNSKIENFQVILNALQELKELGIPKELQKAPLKELEAIVLQKNGIEVPKELAKNLFVMFSEKPVFATINLKADFANTANSQLQITPLPPQEQPQEQKQSQKITHTFEITLPKDFPLQKILANIPLALAQNFSHLIPQFSQQPSLQSSSQFLSQPSPQSLPQPSPQSLPQPSPQPLPQPSPQPLPQPSPQPLPQPSPQPLPQPSPQSLPQSSSQPLPQLSLQPLSQPLSQKIELAFSLYQIIPRATSNSLPQVQTQIQPKIQQQAQVQPQIQSQIQTNEAKFILQPWTASFVIPKEERDFWLKTNLPLTPQILNIRETVLSSGKLPENPEIVRSFASGIHELSLLTEHGVSVSKEQANLLWRFVQATANELQITEKLPTQITQTLLKYQPLGNYEGDLFKSLPEFVKRELLQELPSGKTWQPETLQKAVEKILEKYIEQPSGMANLNEHTSKAHEEIRNALQNLKEQIQWTRIDQDTRPQNDKENVFYFMHNSELQKGRVKIKDERRNGSKKQQDSSISFTIKTNVKNLGEVNADLTLSKNILNIRLQDEIGTAGDAVKEERETLAKELSDIGITLGEILYGKTPKIQNLPVAKKEKSKGGLDVRA